ncbi:hypothetical protein KY289_035819 [Solanum tuberosum]|nr:hypothetical protein KY289_035819 [Solanum tuberosum]
MAKSAIPSSSATRKSSRNKNKGKAPADIFLVFDGSDDQAPLASVALSRGKLHVDSDDSGSPKKKFKFDFDSSLDKKGWANIFSVPMVVYEPLIRLFYANLRSPKAGELESLVLGKRIFIDRKKFDSMLGISCSGIMASSKNCWPSDCDVSFDQAKREIALDPSKPFPSHLGPKDLPFESRVIAHIVATTLLPRAGSHSTLTQRDTLFVYCLVSGVKVHLSSFIIAAMTDVIVDLTSLPFGMLITRIFEYQYLCLGDFSPVFIKQCYNSRAFQSMGFIHSGSSWLLKTDFDESRAKHETLKPSASTSVSTAKLSAALENLDAMHAKLDTMSITISQDVSKETGADVAKIRLRLNQIVTEAIKIATKVQAGSKAISSSLSSSFE